MTGESVGPIEMALSGSIYTVLRNHEVLRNGQKGVVDLFLAISFGRNGRFRRFIEGFCSIFYLC